MRGMSERPVTGMRRVTPGRRTASRARGIRGMVDLAVKPMSNSRRNPDDYPAPIFSNADLSGGRTRGYGKETKTKEISDMDKASKCMAVIDSWNLIDCSQPCHSPGSRRSRGPTKWTRWA
jgi:hypothetical protein